MKPIKKLKQSLKKGKDVLRYVNEASKVRFEASDVRFKIKYGVPLLGVKGVLERESFKKLSDANKIKAMVIIDEECERKMQWKAKELVGVAKIIEKRLKEECKGD